jgi:hypothetical protein
MRSAEKACVSARGGVCLRGLLISKGRRWFGMEPGVEVKRRLVLVARSLEVVRMCCQLEMGPAELVECLEGLLECVGAALRSAKAEVAKEVV